MTCQQDAASSQTLPLIPACLAALASSFNPERRRPAGQEGTQTQSCRQKSFAMPGPQPVCLSGGVVGELPTLSQRPCLKLVQYRTSQFIVFLDINIDSG